MKCDIILKTDQYFYGPIKLGTKELVNTIAQVTNQSDPKRNGTWFIRHGLWERVQPTQETLP
jgi:hypothetical protein